MKEAIILKGPTVKIIESPIPEPNDDQVVTKVVVSGSNPKDWYVTSSILHDSMVS
jgi:NADPH2:quinone reductase